MHTAYLGIDIAKAKFDVALLRGEKFKNRVFTNTPEGFNELLSWLAAQGQEQNQLSVCMEATGSYYEALALFLNDQGIHVSVINPYLIARYAQAVNQVQKTDQQDARVLARYASREQPAPWQAPSPAQRRLRELTRRLDALHDLRQQESNRIHSSSALVQKSITSVIAALNEQIKAIEEQIEQHLDQDPDLKRDAQLLHTIPGVGAATVGKVLSEIPHAVLADVRKADSFVGLVPRQHQSGSSVKGATRLTKQGNSRLRSALYMPAVVAMRFNPVVQAFYARMLSNGLSKKAAICACMRKLLHLMIGVLKSQKPFDAQLHTPTGVTTMSVQGC